jgi:hypothetical protein
MLGSYEATVSALSDSMIRERCPASAAVRSGDAACFVLAQIGRMPDYLRWPMRCLTRLFDLCGWRPGRGCFHAQEHPRRWRQIECWRRSRLGVCRDLIRLYESLVIFWCYSAAHDENDEQVVPLGTAFGRGDRPPAERVAAG